MKPSIDKTLTSHKKKYFNAKALNLHMKQKLSQNLPTKMTQVSTKMLCMQSREIMNKQIKIKQQKNNNIRHRNSEGNIYYKKQIMTAEIKLEKH